MPGNVLYIYRVVSSLFSAMPGYLGSLFSSVFYCLLLILLHYNRTPTSLLQRMVISAITTTTTTDTHHTWGGSKSLMKAYLSQAFETGKKKCRRTKIKPHFWIPQERQKDCIPLVTEEKNKRKIVLEIHNIRISAVWEFRKWATISLPYFIIFLCILLRTFRRRHPFSISTVQNNTKIRLYMFNNANNNADGVGEVRIDPTHV